MFNPLKYAKQLESTGLTREQADAHMQILGEVMETNFATREDMKDVRQDIKNVRQELKTEISDLRQELKTEINDLRQELKTEISDVRQDMDLGFAKMQGQIDRLASQIIQVEQRMTIKLGTIVSVAIAVAVALAKIVS